MAALTAAYRQTQYGSTRQDTSTASRSHRQFQSSASWILPRSSCQHECYEQSEELVRAVERGWTRHFGPPTILQADDHRGWASEQLRTWASDHGTELEISPGQAHTRLSIVERRRQILRRGIELFLAHRREEQPDHDPNMPHRDNNTPNVQGYTGSEWAMGTQPRIPGVLMDHDHDLTPAQLTPSEAMETKLALQEQAAIAVIEADNDARLRRALLRQHQAIQYVYHTGQRVYYWRDAPGGAGPKLGWKGPATVVMTEEGRTGPAKTHTGSHTAQHCFESVANTYAMISTTRTTPIPSSGQRMPWTKSVAEAPLCTRTYKRQTSANALKWSPKMKMTQR